MKRLVTEEDVRIASRVGEPVAVADSGLVTPAARDLARQLGVKITRPEPRADLTQPLAGLVAVGSDHGGFDLKLELIPTVEELGFEVRDVGCPDRESVDYPVYAARVAELVRSGEARFGLMIDGAGIGSSMVCNKVPGVRAALCYDLTTAHNAREHNDANVLTLGGSLIGVRLARDILSTFLTTEFGGGRHQRRVALIEALDQSG